MIQNFIWKLTKIGETISKRGGVHPQLTSHSTAHQNGTSIKGWTVMINCWCAPPFLFSYPLSAVKRALAFYIGVFLAIFYFYGVIYKTTILHTKNPIKTNPPKKKKKGEREIFLLPSFTVSIAGLQESLIFILFFFICIYFFLHFRRFLCQTPPFSWSISWKYTFLLPSYLRHCGMILWLQKQPKFHPLFF